MVKEKVLKKAAGGWKDKMKESGVEFVRNIRDGWKKRKAVLRD